MLCGLLRVVSWVRDPVGVGQHHRQWFENNSQASSHVCCLLLALWVVCIFKLSKYLYAFWQVQIYAKNVDEDTGKHKQSAEFKWSINCSWHFSWVEVIKHSNGRRWQTYHDKVVQFSVNFPPFPDCRRHSRQSLIEFWVPPIDLKPHGRGWWASYGWGAATKQFFGSELPLDRAQFKDFIFLVWIIAIERGKIEKIEIDLHCTRCALEHSHKWLCKKARAAALLTLCASASEKKVFVLYQSENPIEGQTFFLNPANRQFSSDLRYSKCRHSAFPAGWNQ